MEKLPKANCKVRRVAENVSWCLADDPKVCRFSLPFGYAHLCQHSSQYERKVIPPEDWPDDDTSKKRPEPADP